MRQLIPSAFRPWKRKEGFTLIEMLIVLVIVALLMAIIIPNVSGQRDRIEAQARTNIEEIVHTQANTYQMVEHETPTLGQLQSEGYLTQKQVDEAIRLLELSAESPIDGSGVGGE